MGALYFLSSTKYSVVERQTKRGKVYDCRFRLTTTDGKTIHKKLSGYPTKTALKEAYTDFVTKNCELLKNNPEAARRKKENATTADRSMNFDDLHAEYMQSLQTQNKESTIYSKEIAYRLYFKPYFENCRVDELTKADFATWQDKLWAMKMPNGENYAYKYLAKMRSYLSAFLTWVSEKYEIPNQLEKVKKPKRRAPKTQMSIWTREEFEKFISVVDDTTFHAMFMMLFFTGRRKGEVLALHNTDVQADRICFDKTYTRKTTDGSTYKITTTKNEKRSWTIIAAPLKDELAHYAPQEPFYFGGDNPIHENTLSHAFDRYIAKAGVKRIRVHDLRHSFVSMCIHLGASVYVVADLIGDKPEQVLKTYGHLYEEDKVKIISRIK